MAHCAVSARNEAPGGTRARTRVLLLRFRRLTLRSATGTAQRAIPTTDCAKLPLPMNLKVSTLKINNLRIFILQGSIRDFIGKFSPSSDAMSSADPTEPFTRPLQPRAFRDGRVKR